MNGTLTNDDIEDLKKRGRESLAASQPLILIENENENEVEEAEVVET